MRFACEQCQTKYSIPDERVRGKILKIRCKTCGCLISVSESGARTTSVGEPAADPGQSTAGLDIRDQLGNDGGGGGDATMIGGMADFFGKLPGAEPPADEWHLSVDGNQQGPIALSNLAQMILDQANTSAELYVWREGFDGWKPPEDVPEVKSALAKAKSAKPAPQPAAKPTPEPKKAAGKAAADSGKPAAKESPLGGAKGKEPAKAAAKPAAKPAVSASLASSDGDGGDATQIGSLNLGDEPTKNPDGDDDDVQDASLLMLGDDAFEALLEKGGGGKPAAGKPAAKPPAKPTPPPPAKTSAPPAFKAPPAMSRTLPLGAKVVPAPAKPAPTSPAPASQPAPAPAVPSVVVATPTPTPAPVAIPAPAAAPAPVETPAPAPAAPAAAAPATPHAFSDLSLAPPPKSASFPIITGPDPGLESHANVEPKKGSKAWIFVVLLLVLGGGAGAYWFLVYQPSQHKPVEAALQDAGVDAATVPDASAKADTPPKGDAGKGDKQAANTGLSDTVLKDLLDTGGSALNKCYTKALKKKKDLAGTKLKVTVEVGSKGKASEVTVDGPEGDGKVLKCVQKAVKKWKYPRQKDDYKTFFTLTVKEAE